MASGEQSLPDGEVDPDVPELVTAAGLLHLGDDDASSDEADSSTPRASLGEDVALPGGRPSPTDLSVDTDEDAMCVVCFERPPETVLEPCGHANLCLTCLSRLAKRRCPTCRARAKKVTIIQAGVPVTRAVRDVIAERKRNELETLDGTLQVVFLGPPSVGKKTLVRKLLSRFPLARGPCGEPGPGARPDPAKPAHVASDEEIFSDGTDFSANAWISNAAVRLSVLRRTSLASRRMMLDDVRVLKPDVLVLCCSAHLPSSFDEMLAWDRVLRSGFARSRMWALLAQDDDDVGCGAEPASLNLPATIASIAPAELRPRGHYLCTHGTAFNIGFRQLSKDIVSIARMARDEQFAAALAAEEARHLALQHAAGTLNEQADAATRVIANNGIPLPSFPNFHVSAAHASRAQTRAGRPADEVRAQYGVRVRAREGGNNGAGFSFAGLANWFSGSPSDS